MPSRLLPSLPTLEELLAAEPLQAVAARLQPQALIAGVRSFLGILDREVRDAAADLRIPDPAVLARQIADWLLAGKLPVLRPVINGTGILLHPEFGPPPLSEEAAHALRIVAAGSTGYFLEAGGEQRIGGNEALAAVLGRIAGSESAWLAGSLNIALHVACASLAAGREVVVARGEVVDDGEGTDLAAIVGGAGARLREIGAANRATPRDYEQALTASTGLILRFHARIGTGATSPTSQAELASFARKAGVPFVEVLSGGGLVGLPDILQAAPTLHDCIQGGADLVLLRGDDLLGGPVCGIVAGRTERVATLRRHPLAELAPASPLTTASLLSTLALYLDLAKVRYRIPILELLSASPDNLKNRAERMAPQIAACAGIAEAQAVELPGLLRPSSAVSSALPGWGVSIRARHGTAANLQSSLLSGPSKVAGILMSERLLINLRSVPARQDMDVIAAFECQATPDPPTEG